MPIDNTGPTCYDLIPVNKVLITQNGEITVHLDTGDPAKSKFNDNSLIISLKTDAVYLNSITDFIHDYGSFFFREYSEISFLNPTTVDIIANIYYKCTL